MATTLHPHIVVWSKISKKCGSYQSYQELDCDTDLFHLQVGPRDYIFNETVQAVCQICKFTVPTKKTYQIW